MANSRVSPTGSSQNQPTISVNFLNVQDIIVASDDAVSNSISVARSLDGGVTYTNQIPLTLPTGFTGLANCISDYGYPNLAIIVAQAFNGLDDESIFVYRSETTTSTTIVFDPAILVNRGYGSRVANNKPYVVVDKAGGSPYLGQVYVTYTRQFGQNLTGTAVFFQKSLDKGHTFLPPVRLSQAKTAIQGSAVTVGLSGEIFIGWIQFTPSLSFKISRSTDGGISFQDVSLSSNLTINLVPDHLPSPSNFIVPTYPNLAGDTSSGTNTGNIYAVWHDYRTGASHILLSRSTDNGVTWSAPLQVDNGATGSQNFFPSVAVSPITGKIAVAYYTNRLNSSLLDVWLAISTDGGLTFANHRVSDMSFDPNNPTSPTIGTYISVAFLLPDNIIVAWTDSRTTFQNIFTGS
ncbi:hypothetical protein BC351_14760 [Paenibacillus ferrarius]|uniref:Sialidase domain-containing protein n=1 Tax=Paenibacillus ferrarius TaxID=1469647 RepID=A0A1V4HRI6_9BACL|nr:sialidase family protein [Paenibacillus ferrarius]OPH61206.1 hypothetical protein BC351_14760 [Paenibacillus ferrarius]